MSYTSQNLLDAVERRSFVPAGQTTFEDDEILLIADEVLRNDLLPNILGLMEEYFINNIDYAITQNLQPYAVPARSIASIIREVHYINDSGSIEDLQRIEPEQIDSTTRTSAKPESFYLKNANVWIHPIPNATQGTLRLMFPLRPSNLIPIADASTVSAIDTATNTVTLTSIPTGWVTGNTFDFISKDGSHNHLDQGFDLVSTLVSGSDVTLPRLPQTLRVGDYISLAEQTPVVQLPAEYRDLLAQGTACFIIEKMNLPGKTFERDQYKKSLENIQRMISPRTQGSPRSVPMPNFL